MTLVKPPVRPYPPVVLPDGKAWRFHGVVDRVVDGDTADVVLTIDIGHGEWNVKLRRIRILGIDSAETSTSIGKVESAYAVAKWTGKTVWVDVVKPDKWGGRDDGNIMSDDMLTDWATDMLATRNAAVYNGGKRAPAV